MPTRWKKFRQSSPCSLSPLQLRSQLLRSWGCGMAKYRVCSGRTTRRRDVRLSLDLEWSRLSPKDSQRSRSCSGDSTTGGSAGNASAPLRESGQVARSSPTVLGNPLALGSLVNRVILPALNRCELRESRVKPPESRSPLQARRSYSRVARLARSAARAGKQSVSLGVPDMVIQRILRHANVSTTATYYIKTAADDVRKAMTKLENRIADGEPIQSDTAGTQESNSSVEPSTIQ